MVKRLLMEELNEVDIFKKDVGQKAATNQK
jgi:hypothetical protein